MKPEVAEAILDRAERRCEVCCSADFGVELDHLWGRRVPDSVESIWALCRDCHYQRTNSIPSAAWWLARVVKHLQKHGYSTERAETRLAWVAARAALTAANK